jgi:hypothetical protein
VHNVVAGAHIDGALSLHTTRKAQAALPNQLHGAHG